MKLDLWSFRTSLKLQWSCVARHLCWSPGVQPQGHCNREIGVEMSQCIHTVKQTKYECGLYNSYCISISFVFLVFLVFLVFFVFVFVLSYLSSLFSIYFIEFPPGRKFSFLTSWQWMRLDTCVIQNEFHQLFVDIDIHKCRLRSTRLLSLIIKYSHNGTASDVWHTQHQIHFYNMELTFALHEILLPRFNTSSAHSADRFGFIAIHCNSL